MLSIAAIRNVQQGDYYLRPNGEYYLSEGEPAGYWLGEGCGPLGLSGEAGPDAFRNLLAGISPDGNRPLVQNSGKADRQPGWDLTFSAPKSVSVLWSQVDAKTRSTVELVQRESVWAAISYLEATAAFTRRGKGGTNVETARLVIAAFDHGSSRARDAQLHTHSIVINVGVRADGTVGAIESKPLYRHKMTAGAIYRAELASQLRRRLGLIVVRDKTGFEIAGVPAALCRRFSSRRQEIEESLLAHGIAGARASALAALTTRSAKIHVPRQQLLGEWKAIGQAHGFGPAQVEKLLSRRCPRRHAGKDAREVIVTAVEALTLRQSSFTEQEMIRAVAEEAPPRGIGSEEVRRIAADYLASSQAVSLGNVAGEVRFTTPEMLKLETDMVACALRLRDRPGIPIKDYDLDPVLDRHRHLNPEQRTALRHLAAPRAIKVLSGLAGTGKTSLMEAARLCYGQMGCRVIGASLSAKAARGLETGAGIPSVTIYRLLMELERLETGQAEAWEHPFRIDVRTVLVIDEAAMVGTRQLARLLEAVERGGGQAILVGDARQLQPIEAGGGFASLAARLGQAELTTVVRQREEWAREAVVHIAYGDAGSALTAFAQRGLVHVAEDRTEAMRALVADWACECAMEGGDHLIFASTVREVSLLNLLAQQERRSRRQIGDRPAIVGGTAVYERDRIVCTRNDRLRGLQNGTLGTVVRVDPITSALTLKMDGGTVVSVPAGYPHLQLGYAITVHRGQGVTVDRASILAGGPMQATEISYVQLSRARVRTTLYIDRANAGDDLTHLVRQMETSHRKELAIDIQERHQGLAPLALQRR